MGQRQEISFQRMKLLNLVLVFNLVNFCKAFQTEPEEITLDGVYKYFTDYFRAKKFYVQIAMQVLPFQLR